MTKQELQEKIKKFNNLKMIIELESFPANDEKSSND